MKKDWCAIHHHVNFIYTEGEDGTKYPTCPHCWDDYFVREKATQQQQELLRKPETA